MYSASFTRNFDFTVEAVGSQKKNCPVWLQSDWSDLIDLIEFDAVGKNIYLRGLEKSVDVTEVSLFLIQPYHKPDLVTNAFKKIFKLWKYSVLFFHNWSWSMCFSKMTRATFIKSVIEVRCIPPNFWSLFWAMIDDESIILLG